MLRRAISLYLVLAAVPVAGEDAQVLAASLPQQDLIDFINGTQYEVDAMIEDFGNYPPSSKDVEDLTNKQMVLLDAQKMMTASLSETSSLNDDASLRVTGLVLAQKLDKEAKMAQRKADDVARLNQIKVARGKAMEEAARKYWREVARRKLDRMEEEAAQKRAEEANYRAFRRPGDHQASHQQADQEKLDEDLDMAEAERKWDAAEAARKMEAETAKHKVAEWQAKADARKVQAKKVMEGLGSLAKKLEEPLDQEITPSNYKRAIPGLLVKAGQVAMEKAQESFKKGMAKQQEKVEAYKSMATMQQEAYKQTLAANKKKMALQKANVEVAPKLTLIAPPDFSADPQAELKYLQTLSEQNHLSWPADLPQ